MFISNFTIKATTTLHIEENERVVLIKEQYPRIKVYNLNGLCLTTLNEEVSKAIFEDTHEYVCFITNVDYKVETIFHRKDEMYEEQYFYEMNLHFKINKLPYFLNQKPDILDGSTLDAKEIQGKLSNSLRNPMILRLILPTSYITVSAYQPLVLIRDYNGFILKTTPNSKRDMDISVGANELLDALFPFIGEYEDTFFTGAYQLIGEKSTEDIKKEKEAINHTFGIEESDTSMSMSYKKNSSSYKQAVRLIQTELYLLEVLISNTSIKQIKEKENLRIPPTQDKWEVLEEFNWKKQQINKPARERSMKTSEEMSEVEVLLDLAREGHESRIVSGELETYDPTYDPTSDLYIDSDERYFARVRDEEE
ncbi:hypothetical protein P5808_20555 [Bacillus cereus]|uniref:hypothetical protein n=1 Tax=Bacillus cereus TaxID=1396 RepID=UPI00240498BD|nr:hypothetical protein [Bacillus cereus]MDF9506735.1 hypothetical protein [Bacillus cereus]MDF9596399.1 hypothetical protein [Bacillus cereus]MDF9608000.1 hypothetical protein [Bacillus cereus]MDF9659213.1 hypothetical protein [Bacillus cereus]